MQASAHRSGLGYAGVVAKWGWFVGLGLLLVVAGVFALGDVMAVTVASVIFIGAMLLVGGIFQIFHAFMTKGWAAFLLNLLGGAAYAIGGLLIMDEPVQGSIFITMFAGAALVIGGLLRVVIALRHREVAGWWMLLLGGLISLALGVLLYASLPWSGLWVLGTLIGVELIVQGVTWVQFGLALRGLHRAA
jgi:uncharacterized membrane protein HdeD (DUF308 family)